MKPSEILYAAAELMQSGYSAQLRDGDCGCFIGRMWDALGDGQDRFLRDNQVRPYIQRVVGVEEFHASALRNAGWTDGCTDDAVAALTIAADIAAAEGL